MIQKPKQSLNVITSYQISKDCILGSMRLDIWVVLDNMAKTLAKCEDTLFYVAGTEIILKNPILGKNFLQKHKVAMNYNSTRKCEILAKTVNTEHKMSYSPLLVNNMNSEIHFHNVTKLNNLSLNEYIFQHRGVNYKNTSGTIMSPLDFTECQAHQESNSSSSTAGSSLNLTWMTVLGSASCQQRLLRKDSWL